MGKAPPPIGPPTGTPEPLVDYIKLLREIMDEIAKVESELNDLSEQTPVRSWRIAWKIATRPAKKWIRSKRKP
jgi:hypothetical protein